MKDNKKNIITCPICGAEYMPGEIFLPKHFLGQPKMTEKDALTGHILYSDGEMDLVENFICEKCNTPFRVSARVQFSTEENRHFNFNSEYTSSLKKPQLFLNEEE